MLTTVVRWWNENTLPNKDVWSLLHSLQLINIHAKKLTTFSLARCSKQTKQIGTEMLFVIRVDSLDGIIEYTALNSTDCETYFFLDVTTVLALSTYIYV